MSLPIILASKSPRRKQLLELAEIPFDIITKDTDESYPLELDTSLIPEYIALNKAKDIQKDYPSRKIIAADTVVVLNDKIIGKPMNREDAIDSLTSLSGQIHTVITGVVILDENRTISFSDTTDVEFHSISNQDIVYYIDTYKPYDKAGAYAIQEWIGAIAIKRINGCFYNVMGLPVSKVVAALKS